MTAAVVAAVAAAALADASVLAAARRVHKLVINISISHGALHPVPNALRAATKGHVLMTECHTGTLEPPRRVSQVHVKGYTLPSPPPSSLGPKENN